MGDNGPTPYRRDHRPRAFTVGALAVDDDAAWVADSYYPLLVRLDPGSGQIEGPFELTGPGRGPGEAGAAPAIRRLAVGHGRIWCQQGSELVRWTPEGGAEARFPLSGGELAIGPDAIWIADDIWSPRGEMLSATGTVLRRLDDPDGRLSEFDLPGLHPRLAAGHEAIWVATHSPDPATTTTLLRIEPGSGKIANELELAGRTRGLWVDEAGVWILTAALRPGGVETHLSGIEPRDLQVRSEVKDPPIHAAALHQGAVWTQSQFDQPAPGEEPAVRRIDPVTGRALGEVRLPFAPRAIKSGAGGVWADLISSVVKLGTEGPLAEFELEGLPVPEHLLPSPLPEIEPEEWEAQARDGLEESFAIHARQEPRSPRGPGGQSRYEHVEFVSAELLGSFPATRLAVYFRAEEHPGYLFGRQWNLWEPDGAAVSHPLDGMIDLMENLDKRAGPILPPGADPDENGIVWI